jgi:hypothetical protein
MTNTQLRDRLNDLKQRNRYVAAKINDVLGVEYRIIDNILNDSVGVYRFDQCDEEQLTLRLRNALRWFEAREVPAPIIEPSS